MRPEWLLCMGLCPCTSTALGMGSPNDAPTACDGSVCACSAPAMCSPSDVRCVRECVCTFTCRPPGFCTPSDPLPVGECIYVMRVGIRVRVLRSACAPRSGRSLYASASPCPCPCTYVYVLSVPVWFPWWHVWRNVQFHRCTLCDVCRWYWTPLGTQCTMWTFVWRALGLSSPNGLPILREF